MKESSSLSCRLHVVSPPALDPIVFSNVLKSVVKAGDIAIFELWQPDATDDQVVKICELIYPVLRAREISLIIADRHKVAKRALCDGVHLKQPGSDIAEAKRILGKKKVIGVHSYADLDLAEKAEKRQADFVLFGPCVKSRLDKPDDVYVTTGLIQEWKDRSSVPAIAAGGLTPENCVPFIEAGADYICSGTEIWTHPGSAAKAVKEFNATIKKTVEKMRT